MRKSIGVVGVMGGIAVLVLLRLILPGSPGLAQVPSAGSAPGVGDPLLALPQDPPGMPQAQATPEPNYLTPQILLDASADLPKCFVGYINSGMVPCGSPPGTDPIHIDIVWPQTIQEYEFSLETEAWLGLEIHKFIDDTYPGNLGVSLYIWDTANGNWAPFQYYWHTGTSNDRGTVSGNFDPDWAYKIQYDADRVLYPAGRYKIMAWAALRYDGWGAVYGYIPSKGTVRVYGFENLPPPTPVPTATPDTEATNPDGVPIRVRVEADGWETIETTYFTDGYDPSSVEIWGTVSDKYGTPIENAEITFTDLGETNWSNWNGSYHLSVETVGTEPWAHELNWTLTPLGSTVTDTPAPLPIFQPSPTPTPISADLSLENGVRILQAIEGGNFVASRDVGVLVQPYWSGSYPMDIPTGYQYKVTLTYDGTALPPVTKGPGRDFTWVIPAGSFNAGSHTISAEVELVGAQIIDSNPANNSFSQTLTAYASQHMRVLFVRVLPNSAPPVSVAEMNSLARDAVKYLRQVYPVPGVMRIPGSYLVYSATDTRLDVSLAVAKTLLRYNNNRCLEYLPDGSFRQKAHCHEPRADLVVGAIPRNYYGESEGWLFGRGASIWGAWIDKLTLGAGWLAGGGISLDRAATNVVTNPINPAHEIGHHFDLNDEYGEGLGKLIKYGFIWRDGQFIQLASQTTEYYNFMGNAGVGYPATQYWVNAETWNKILQQIVTNQQVALPRDLASLDPIALPQAGSETFGPALLVSGSINQTGGAITAIEPIQRYEVLTSDQGAWILEAVDAHGTVLGLVRFDTYPGEISAERPFLVSLPVSDQAAVTEIRLRQEATIVASYTRSPSAPTLSLSGTPDLSQASTTLSWAAQDPDGNASPLRSTVYYSSDGGSTWQALVQDTLESQVQFEPAEIGGGSVQFRIVTSDGFNETSLLLDPLQLADHLPVVYIESPAGTEFLEGDAVLLQGFGEDIEDGSLPDDRLAWFDASSQSIGVGSLLHIELPVGTHILTLRGQDASGQTQVANLTVRVQAAPSTPLQTGDLSWLVLAGAGLILLLIVGGILTLIFFLWLRRRSSGARSSGARSSGARAPIQAPQAAANGAYQDQQGRWWYQDPGSGAMYFWNGSAWQQALGVPITPPAVPRAGKPGRRQVQPGSGSCLSSVVLVAVLGVLIFGGVSLVSWNFIPGYNLPPAQNVVVKDILTQFGGGALLVLLGTLTLRSGFKAVITRRSISQDEWGHRREQRGCFAVLNGLWQSLFGLALLIAGFLLMSISVYQQILPWLGI